MIISSARCAMMSSLADVGILAWPSNQISFLLSFGRLGQARHATFVPPPPVSRTPPFFNKYKISHDGLENLNMKKSSQIQRKPWQILLIFPTTRHQTARTCYIHNEQYYFVTNNNSAYVVCVIETVGGESK